MIQPGPAHWNAVDRAVKKSNELKATLETKSDDYLQGIIEGSKKNLGWIKFKGFLKGVNPLNYGGDYFYEEGAMYELAREILIERELKDLDIPELIDAGKKTFLDKLWPFYESNSDNAVKRSMAREIINKKIPKYQQRLFDLY